MMERSKGVQGGEILDLCHFSAQIKFGPAPLLYGVGGAAAGCRECFEAK